VTSVARRRTLELALVVVPGVLNFASELAWLSKTVVVAGAALAWVAYAAPRLVRDRSAAREWGFRADTWPAAARAVAVVTALGIGLLAASGAAAGHLPPPRGFWVALALYPAWGLAQQFLLNGVLLRNLRALLPERLALPLAAALFAASHLPDLSLAALTLPAGLAWGWIYLRWPNLWALALGHGVLGAAAYYLVLGRDPLAALGL